MCGVRPCGGGSGEGTHERGRVLGCGADREALAPTPSRPLVAGRSARRGVARPVPFLLFLAGTTRIWFLRPFSQGLALTDRLSTDRGPNNSENLHGTEHPTAPLCDAKEAAPRGQESVERECSSVRRGRARPPLLC